MPYRSNRELPDAVKNVVPSAAGRTTWRTIYNNAAEQYGEDSARAFATAWSGFQAAGWAKNDEGQWVKVEKILLGMIRLPIVKTDDVQQRVFGWASVAVTKDGEPLEDLQGDVIDENDLAEAFYVYMRDSRELNFDHTGPVRGELIECCVFTPEKLEKMGLPPGSLPLAAWVGYEIDDRADYDLAKAEGLLMFSIEGTAVREPVA